MEKRKFGDRKDAKRIRNVQSMNQIMIDLKPNRNLGEVYVNQKIDVTNLMEYYEECKKKNPNDNITLFHMRRVRFPMFHRNFPYVSRYDCIQWWCRRFSRASGSPHHNRRGSSVRTVFADRQSAVFSVRPYRSPAVASAKHLCRHTRLTERGFPIII